MPISAYVGSLGSGKSYEVVSGVIVPACASGRRVVTNIYGISEELVHKYCIKNLKKSADELGMIIYVKNDQIMEENFFPYKDSKPEDTFCQHGDLIIVDECWRIWESDKSINEKHRSFIAEHRHFNENEKGICCDLVVINQEVSGLPRFIKARLDTTFKMQKHIALGLKNRYRVDVFTGAKTFKNNRVTSYQKKYQPDIFPLYKSYEGGGGTELTVDNRASILGKKWIILLPFILIAMFIFGVSYLYNFLHPEAQSEKIKPDNSSIKTSSNSNESPNNIVGNVVSAPQISSNWRISGKLNKNGLNYVILSNLDGRIKMVPATEFNYQGLQMMGLVDGEIVTFYSGGSK